MSPPVATLPSRAVGSSSCSARRAATLVLALAFIAAGCSSRKSSGGTTPVEQLPPPILTGTGVPAGPAVEATIGPAGGTLESADGRLSLAVPAGAVASATPFTVQPITAKALGGVGGAFRIRPEGVALAKPVTLVLKGPDTFQAGVSIEDLGISYQDATGFWYPVKEVARDAVKNTLTATTTHFSDWGVTFQAGVPGLYGAFTLDQSVGIPFTATGNATLFYQGDNATKTLYVLTGDTTVPASVPYQGATCAPAPPLITTMAPTVAELWKSPVDFRWSINGQWDLTCTDAGGATSPQFMSAIFDSMGINLIGCARSYVGTPTFGTDRVTATYLIDCGSSGRVQASWDFIACVPGVLCTPANACHLGATDCTTGRPVCADTGTAIPDGTTCGTDQVCNAGACVVCAANQACTGQTDPLCHTGTTSCSTGRSVCINGAALANGTSCGVNQVCNAGTCSACTAGATCATQPDLLCHLGVSNCSTGVETCLDGAAVANGTSCGTDQVCNGGACAACAANLVCSTQPDTLCHAGVTSCATGASVCVNGAALANGTACGSNQVCNAGACATCAANQICTGQPDPLCHTGLTDCSTGSSTCLNGAPVADGTSCGVNLVCSAGACGSCTAGAACTTQPDLLCHDGVTSCSTGSSVCVNGAAKVNGTVCGVNQVCNAGACGACTAGQACATQPDTLCHAGVTSCATGASACVNGAALADGTSCGTNQVCNAGACGSCTAGTVCTGQPDPLCHAGVTSCATGASVCVNGAALANGTSCGTNQVCSAGACGSCTAGAVCTTQPDPLCHEGVTSCSTGAPVCLDGAPKANGTGCGTNLVCGGGSCNACTAAAACATQPDLLCHTGTTVCTSGFPVCANGAALPDGTGCGTGQTCSAGACVASRTVTGTRLVTLWPDPPAAQASGPAPDVLVATIAAAVPDGLGGWRSYLGTFDAAGSFTIPAVPSGSYLLLFKDGTGLQWVVATSASTVDLGYDLTGRASPALAAASAPTPVTLDLTAGGLDPWDTTGDQLQLASSNADLWDLPISGAGLAAAATAGTAVEDWFLSAAGIPLDLLGAGDVLSVHQLHAATATSTTADATAYRYLAATKAATVTGVSLTSGAAATITVPALAAPTSAGSLSVDWTLSAFDALVPSMLPAAATGTTTHALRVGASAHTLASPAPRSRAARAPTLLELQASAGGPAAVAFAAPLAYGHALPAPWTEWREASLTAHADFTAPGAATPVRLDVTVGQRVAMSPPPATPIVPTLAPVTGLLLGGAAASSPRTGVGLTPTLAWTAPGTGTPTSYAVDLFRLGASGSSSTATRGATLITASTSIQLPSGVLAGGQTYLAYVTARAANGDAPASAPFRAAGAYAWASAVTGTFAP